MQVAYSILQPGERKTYVTYVVAHGPLVWTARPIFLDLLTFADISHITIIVGFSGRCQEADV